MLGISLLDEELLTSQALFHEMSEEVSEYVSESVS